QGGRAGERLLAVGGHDGLARAAACHRIAAPAPVLLHDARAALAVAPWAPGNRLDKHIHLPSGGYAEKTKTQESAELPDAGVGLPTRAAARCTHGEPHLIAGGRTVHSLEDELQREGELQLADDESRRLAVARGDEIASANLALHLEAELFEEALDGKVEARFHGQDPLPGSR